MLLEMSIIPIESEARWTDHRAEVLKLVDASGLAYQLTPSGTCIEGNWDEVMKLVRRCHDRVRKSSPHVVVTIRIEDQEGVTDQLMRNVTTVEEQVGRAPHGVTR